MVNTQSATVCECCGNQHNTYAKSGGENLQSNWSTAFIAFGWVFFAISLIFVPIVFGAAAFLMGFLTFTDRSPVHGAVLMTFSAVSTILGSIFSFVVAGTMFL